MVLTALFVNVTYCGMYDPDISGKEYIRLYHKQNACNDIIIHI